MSRNLTVRSACAGAAAALALSVVAIAPPARAAIGGVCATATLYEACARVFPDPLAGTGRDPNAEGTVPAADFIQFGVPGTAAGSEIWDGLRFLESRYGRFLQLWRLDDLLDDPDALSSGLWLAGRRTRLPLILARATDETVPAAQKRRFVFGLSLHGIERAGVEGGTRALEDLVTYAYCESLGDLDAARADAACAGQTHVRLGGFSEGAGGFPARLLPWDETSLTMGEVLKRTELYFAYNNPDGWHRGDRPEYGGVLHYQRYNGNGVDPNRDWPTAGWTFSGYTPGSEPETRSFARALKRISDAWAGGLDLHGQLNAPVLTYTMLPAGQNDFAKNARIRAVAERTQADALERLTWSPLIRTPGQTGPTVGRMLPQRWGTVWDTINYTTTGSLGDWINSPEIGLGGIGMDNEMSYSHTTNCGIGSCFVPDIEQLHVAGNKGLIFSQVDTVLRTEGQAYRFPFSGRGAYVRFDNTLRAQASARALNTSDLPAQDPITGTFRCVPPECPSDEFVVEGATDGVRNGGLTVNVGYLGSHTFNDFSTDTVVQRLDDSHGEETWETVGTHYNEGQPYFSNGATVTVNDPVPGRYRVVIQGGPVPGLYSFEALFSRGQAHDDPGQRAYEVTNFEFFDELNRYLPERNRFEALTAARILDDPSVLRAFDVVVLVEDPLRGWNEEKPSRSALSRADHDRYYDALRDHVRRGGVLVLLDGALQGLRDLTGNIDLEASRSHHYAGYIQFNDGSATTYEDPLAAGVNAPGAAEGGNNRHQTYEPVPLGYRISVETQDFPNSAPAWNVDQAAFEEAGGRTVGRTEGVSLGELKLGKGAIRFAGALLPSPTNEFEHPFGLRSYALTYSGWQLFQNLVHVDAAEPEHPRVGGAEFEPDLPRTGVGAPAAIFLVAAAIGLAIARRLRDVSWV